MPSGAFQNPLTMNTHAKPPLQPHSAPLGLTFYFGDMFPEEYQGDLFVAFHGSWNRKEPTDYKIVTIDMNDLEVNDLATGQLIEGQCTGKAGGHYHKR